MPSYKYRAMDEEGNIVRGKILAINKDKAIESLKEENVQPIAVVRLYEQKSKYKNIDSSKINKYVKMMANKDNQRIAKKKKKLFDTSKLANRKITELTLEDLTSAFTGTFTRVTTKDIVAFMNNLYILKKSKFNNVQALQAILKGLDNKSFKEVIENILIEVQSGERLYRAMAKYEKIFPMMVINFIRVGEESGTLDVALLYARDYIESSTTLRKQVKSAIIPRVIQFFGIIIAMFACLIIGVPILEDVYATFDSSQTIPAATMMALNFAKWCLNYWYLIVGTILLIVFLVYSYVMTPKGRYKWDKFLMTGPVIGRLMTNITISKFFQAMMLNIKNGMRIQESLEVSKNVTSNYYFLSAVEAGKANSIAGTSWIEPFQEKGIFNAMVSEMTEIGMQTDLTEMMEKINEYIQVEIDESIAKFVKVLPEITYLFVGIALIAFMIAVMVPLINVYMGGFIEM